MKRRDYEFIGSVPAVTLTLSVLLCIGALSDGSSAAAVVAQNLSRHGITAGERESVASLLSNLNEAARKLCRVPSGQSVGIAPIPIELLMGKEPTAHRAYQAEPRHETRPALQVHLLNLPPPAATL